MTTASSSRFLFGCFAAAVASLTYAPVSAAENGVKLRAIHPKPFYRPGDKIDLEVRCLGAVQQDPTITYSESPDRADGDTSLLEEFKCPVARFRIEIPKDFIGKNWVQAFADLGSHTFRDVFTFEVRVEARPVALFFSTNSRDEGCHFSFAQNRRPPWDIDLYSVMADGTRFELCKEGKVVVTTEPPGIAVFTMEEQFCSLAAKAPSTFRLKASYRGLEKEWSCTVDAPAPVKPRQRGGP